MVIDVNEIYLITFNCLYGFSLFRRRLFLGRRSGSWRGSVDLKCSARRLYLKVDNTCICWLWWLRWLRFILFASIKTIIIPAFSCKLHVWWWKQIELFLCSLWYFEFWTWFAHGWITEICTSHSEGWRVHSCVHLLGIILVDLYQLLLDVTPSWYCLELHMLVPSHSLSRNGHQLLP